MTTLAPATAAGDVRRWTFRMPTPLGITESTFELTDEGLRFTTDDAFAGSETLHWAGIERGCTAAMAGMGGRGAPDLPNWIPAQLEWVLLSRRAGAGAPFMRALPQGTDRDAIVAALEARLGAGWIGTRLPLQEAQRRLGIAPPAWGTLKVAGIVLAVLAMLALLLILLGLLLHPLILIPAGFALGGWLCHRGLGGLRDALAVANTPTAQAASAALGLVELEGRALAAETAAAGITGRPCAWWDVAVFLWYEDSQRQGEWRQVAARHGGRVDRVEFEDDSGRLPIWLPGATLLLEQRAWESPRDSLPAAGTALLDALGFPWNDGRRIRVTEQCLETGRTLYVLGTLDERRRLREPSEAGLLERAQQSVRSGRWRRDVVAATPPPLRVAVAVLIGYLDLLTSIGSAGARPARDIVAAPPPLAPEALVIWKGRQGRPFIVSDRPEAAALADLRRRSLWTFGIGGALLCFTLYQLIDTFTGA